MTHHITTKHKALLGLAIGSVAVIGILVSQPRLAQANPPLATLFPAVLQGAPPGPPNTQALAMLPESLSLSYPSSVVQGIWASTTDKYGIVFDWRLCPGPVGSPNLAVKSEQYATSYCPTSFAIADAPVATVTAPLVVYVAGRGLRGDTIIEEWQFDRSGAYAPGARQVVDSATGAISYLWALPVRTTVKEIYRDNRADLDTVAWVMPMHAGSGKLLIQFWSNKDVYSVRLNDGLLTKIASPVSGTGWIAEPALGSEFAHYYSFERQGEGYVYMLTVDSYEDPVSVQGLAIRDTNKDDTVDSISVISAAQWSSNGWGNSGTYVKTFVP